MATFVCPVCGGALSKNESSYACGSGHSFDIARQGYVNLLRSQKSAAGHHGDDKLMVQARQRFLKKGYYIPLLEALSLLSVKLTGAAPSVLDAGCGEGWYTENIIKRLRGAGKEADVTGIDISKDALRAAGIRRSGASLAVASAYDLPLPDGSMDLVLNIFSPLAEGEFRRVLKTGGALIRAVPDEKHLFSLKEKIYEKPYLNDPVETELYGFELAADVPVYYELSLRSAEDITALFMMTPYYYKTSAEDQKKAMRLTELDTQAQFRVLAYRRK